MTRAGACLFCAIAQGSVAAHTVDSTDEFVAFLDHRPLFIGHTLVTPRTHCETLVDVPSTMMGPLFTYTQKVARAVEAGLSADGFFVAINNRVSQSVPHLHVHVIPRRKKDGLKGFFWPRQKYGSEQEMARVAEAIRSALVG